MCGIAGFLASRGVPSDAEERTKRMLAAIRYRGPDEFGLYLDEDVALGSVRLSIVDLASGQQPIANEDETLWIVFNGEIFNHVELRPELEARGHRFSTHSDTEVVLHLFEEMGPECLAKLNGQFAFAIWDTRTRSLFLARDRMGERPLFYAWHEGTLYFGSEVKAILNGAPIGAEIDPAALCDVFTFWALPPGHYLVATRDGSRIERYWEIRFPLPEGMGHREIVREDAASEELERLLKDSVRVRLRADVPVGVYLSGGLDSSTIVSMVRDQNSNPLHAFSVAFTDASFDEREHQKRHDRRDHEPATTPAAAEMGANLAEHPDRQTGDGQRPDPAEEVHDGGARLEHHQAEPDRAQNHRRHRRPGLRLGAEARGQQGHQAPAEAEGEEDRSGDHRLRAARRQAEQEGDREGSPGEERAEDCENR